MAKQDRFVIKHPKGTFYAHCEQAGTVEVIERDFYNNRSVHDRHLLDPQFKDASQAAKFDTETDASAMLTHEHLKDSAAFEGCTVEPADE